MKLLTSLLSIIFLYHISSAQGTNYSSAPSPPDKANRTETHRFEWGDLKGPRAKNHPTHAYRSSKVVATHPGSSTQKRMGPSAKNYKPWDRDTSHRSVLITSGKKKNLKGPRAKNRKPGDPR